MPSMRQSVRTLYSYAYDLRRFMTQSGLSGRKEIEILEAQILREQHRIEKGLSLPSPKEWFGQTAIENTLAYCARYEQHRDRDPLITEAALSAIAEYSRSFGTEPPEWWQGVEAQIAAFGRTAMTDSGGTKPISAAYLNPRELPIQNLMRGRSSVRNFSEQIVAENLIQDAIYSAKKSPSVCNRQATRIRIFRRGPDAHQLLGLQNGNRAFGHTASHIALVTSDLRCFLNPGERSQGYVDAGMFTMTFIYDLLGAGVGTCCLNWSVEPKRDKELRRSFGLPENEAVIMMLAIGYPSTDIKVTISPARDNSRIEIDV